MRFTWMIRRNYATIYCSPIGSSTLPSPRMPLRRRTLPGRRVFRSLIPIRSLRRALSLRRRASHPKLSNKGVRIMKKTIVSLLSFAITLLPFATASAYSHANAYGGSTSHSYGSTSHSNAYGGSSSHTYGEGSSHTNEYGGSTSHSAYGGTSHTNTYGGTTSGEAGYGAVHTDPNGATAYHPPPDAYGYHPPAAYYPYHPPTTVGYYGAGCYNCSSGSAAGAAVGGAVVGATVGAAAASSQSAAASQNAYAQGYNAGTSSASAANANAAAANANAAAANANAAAANANVAAVSTNMAYEMGAVYGALPSGCIQPSVSGGGTYYLCGNTWFSPAYGANGVHYTVVPAP